MKTVFTISAGCLLAAAFFSVCNHDKRITDNNPKTDFSGIYCLNALNIGMTIVQARDSVTFTLQSDLLAHGTGAITGDTLQLTAGTSGGETFTCRLGFSRDRQSFSGAYRMTDAAGRNTGEGLLQGSKGDCPKWDIAAKGIPRFVSHDFTQLSKIDKISKFRSAAGHDYSDGSETCRSMKHYYSVHDSLRKNNAVEIYSPVEGSVVSVSNDGHGASIGLNNKQIQIKPDDQPAFIIRIFHCDLASSAIATGKKVQAGESLGYARLYYEDLGEYSGSFDIAVWVNTPAGMRLVPYFDVMKDEVFNGYILRGAGSRQDFVISREARDADPLECSGETFLTGGHLEDWVTLH